MDEQKNQSEIDIMGLARAVLRRAWLVALAAAVCAGLTLVSTLLLVTPKYQASTKLYVNNRASDSGSITSSDISTSRNLVDTYIIILNTPETLNAVIDYAGVDRDYEALSRMISASAVDNTEIFQVTVTGTDPEELLRIAQAIAHILPLQIADTIESSTSVKVVQAPLLPTAPSSPSYALSALVGLLAGGALAVAVIVIRALVDTTIRTEEDIAQLCHHPILAAIPDMNGEGKGKVGRPNSEPIALVGGQISFAAAEAYKLLRAKLQFSFSESGCHVIGLSSALSGEGKSLSSVNLAYSLAELGKKVLLIDCDMRRPTLAEKLGIQKFPGFSSYLTGQEALEGLIRPSGLLEELHVITAGQNPPNPNELLSSAKMSAAMEALRRRYDYVLLDLPPVGEVSDAITVTAVADGILLVVRENFCHRQVLAHTLQQFAYVNARLLGLVVNCAAEKGGKYGKYYYHPDRQRL